MLQNDSFLWDMLYASNKILERTYFKVFELIVQVVDGFFACVLLQYGDFVRF